MNSHSNIGENKRHNVRKHNVKCYTHRNELCYNNGHFPDLVQDIFKEKNGGLNLVLWHAKPRTLMALLSITLK